MSKKNVSDSDISKIITDSVPGAMQVRGERGSKTSVQMLQAAYKAGLFTLGSPTSPTNAEIRPALQYIFKSVATLKANDFKRVAILSSLVNACRDCQQVQAREILRIYGEMTNQAATLEQQVRFFLVKQKEEALYQLITEKHKKCDESHTKVGSGGQRAHLQSVYIDMLGPNFGLSGLQAARADRFLVEAKKNVSMKRMEVEKRLIGFLCPARLRRELLADINNQSAVAERLINRDCIFKWATKNMTTKDAYRIFYDEDRADEFKEMEPDKPTEDNQYQPFLSTRVITDVLVEMKMLSKDPSNQYVPSDKTCASNFTAATKSTSSRPASASASSPSLSWQFEDGAPHSNNWKPYSAADQNALEGAFTKGSSSLTLANKWGTYAVSGLQGAAPQQKNTKTNAIRLMRRI